MKGIKMPSLKPHRLRKGFIIFFAVASCVILLGLGIFSHYLSHQIEERLTALGCKAGSVNVNIFSRTISISAFDLIPDSANNVPLRAQLKNIVIKNIGLYSFLVNNELRVKEVLLEEGTIRFNEKKKTQDDRKQSKENSLKKIFINRVLIEDLNTIIAADSLTHYSGII